MHAERTKKLGLLRDADGAHPAQPLGGLTMEEERMSEEEE